MKRILPLVLLLPLSVIGYACGSKSDDNPTGPAGTGPGGGDNSSSGGGSTAPPPPPPSDLTKNPIDGIAPPAVIIDTGAYTDGPVWHAGIGVLFFTTPFGEPGLYRMRPDGSALKLRGGDVPSGAIPIGNAVDSTGTLVTFEALRIMKGGATTDAGDVPTQVASGYFQDEAGFEKFDTLKAGVIRKDGTMYVTDPGYFAAPVANRIYRVDPKGDVTVVEAFEDVPRPNGVALSPDQTTLYVGFSAPEANVIPYIRKYYVNDDGTLGEHAKFVDVDPQDSAPDGIEVDQAGNVYVATTEGIAVFKQDGTKIGVVAIPDIPTGMAFAGKDLKTMYVTTQGTKIYQLTLNVPGIAQ